MYTIYYPGGPRRRIPEGISKGGVVPLRPNNDRRGSESVLKHAKRDEASQARLGRDPVSVSARGGASSA